MTVPSSEPRAFADLRSAGLLWLINTTVFHPRGFALALHFDDQGTATGWSLQGDGSEPWEFQLSGAEKDRLFGAVQELLRDQASAGSPSS